MSNKLTSLDFRIDKGKFGFWYDFDKLIPFQGELVEMTERKAGKLIKSLEKYYIDPFLVWCAPDENVYILGGHQRQKVMKAEGFTGQVPCVPIRCNNEKEAKEFILKYRSQYGDMPGDKLHEHLEVNDLDYQVLKDEIDFAGMNKEKMGRPTKFAGIVLETVSRLYQVGLTDKEVAFALGIAEATLHNWKKSKPNFLESIKKGKAVADAKVKLKLYERAVGYSHQAVKIFCNKDGDVTKVPYIEYFPPDTTAGIYWTKNRMPKEWRDKHHLDHSGEVIHNVTITMDDFKKKIEDEDDKKD
jgi:hypothetical protein